MKTNKIRGGGGGQAFPSCKITGNTNSIFANMKHKLTSNEMSGRVEREGGSREVFIQLNDIFIKWVLIFFQFQFQTFRVHILRKTSLFLPSPFSLSLSPSPFSLSLTLLSLSCCSQIICVTPCCAPCAGIKPPT